MEFAHKATAQDRLGFEPSVRAMETLIQDLSSDDLPITFGIFGPWGSGKTSFMQQLQARLTHPGDGSPSIPCIWFDAWKYDRTQDVRAALVYKILGTLRDEKGLKAEVRSSIASVITKVPKLTLALASRTNISLGLPMLNIQIPSLAEMQAVSEEMAQEQEAFQTEVDQFSEQFAAAVDAYLDSRGSGDKLAVIIDDLDRCLPENVIIILEALKLYLDDARCVFILGIDRTIVEAAVRTRYGPDSGLSGRQYLDKIIQFPFSVPQGVRTALESRFNPSSGPSRRDRERSNIFAIASNGNPRTYSRLVASWRLIELMAPNLFLPMQAPEHRRMLALAIAIHTRFPELFEVCRDNPRGFPSFVRTTVDGGTTLRQDLEVTAPPYAQFLRNPQITSFLLDVSRAEKSLVSDLENLGIHIYHAFSLVSRT